MSSDTSLMVKIGGEFEDDRANSLPWLRLQVSLEVPGPTWFRCLACALSGRQRDSYEARCRHRQYAGRDELQWGARSIAGKHGWSPLRRS